MTNNNLKYLIAGTGGVGGSIAAFLSLSGKDVTCIARGEHLAAIRKNGLQLHSDLKGEHSLKVASFTAEEFQGKADVIFVCVKGYSVDSITELIKRASHDRTVVIPILNVYGTGPRIQRLVPGVTVLDGCIYIVGFVSGRGEITQMGKIFPSTEHTAARLFPVKHWKPCNTICRKAASKPKSPTTSTGTHSSSGRSSRQWPSPEPITTYLWAKSRNRAKCATPLSGCHKRAQLWAGNWV